MRLMNDQIRTIASNLSRIHCDYTWQMQTLWMFLSRSGLIHSCCYHSVSTTDGLSSGNSQHALNKICLAFMVKLTEI